MEGIIAIKELLNFFSHGKCVERILFYGDRWNLFNPQRILRGLLAEMEICKCFQLLTLLCERILSMENMWKIFNP